MDAVDYSELTWSQFAQPIPITLMVFIYLCVGQSFAETVREAMKPHRPTLAIRLAALFAWPVVLPWMLVGGARVLYGRRARGERPGSDADRQDPPGNP